MKAVSIRYVVSGVVVLATLAFSGVLGIRSGDSLRYLIAFCSSLFVTCAVIEFAMPTPAKPGILRGLLLAAARGAYVGVCAGLVFYAIGFLMHYTPGSDKDGIYFTIFLPPAVLLGAISGAISRHFVRERHKAPNKSLQPTAAAPGS